MRKLGLGLVVLGSLAVTAEAESWHAVTKSNGALASFSGTSADGCIYTEGVIFTQQTDNGAVADIATFAWDSCHEGRQGFLIGEIPVADAGDGLGTAKVSGTLVTSEDIQGQLAPLTFELSLTFKGTGRTIIDKSHWTSVSPGGDVTVGAYSSRRRAATVTGTMTVDGGAVTFSDAFIGSGISVDVTVVH